MISQPTPAQGFHVYYGLEKVVFGGGELLTVSHVKLPLYVFLKDLEV